MRGNSLKRDIVDYEKVTTKSITKHNAKLLILPEQDREHIESINA